jgi:hypothetical protein
VIGMLALMKRRALVYTLPPIVLIAFLTLISMAAWQRSQMIADLTHKLARGEKVEAEAAARQLAVISNPPLDLLVDVAASNDGARAEAAQVALNRMLDCLELDADAGRRLRRVSEIVTELSATLAKHRQAFPRASHPWLADATRRILSIANRCPATTPLIGLHCDEVMSVVLLARPVTAAAAVQTVAPPAAVPVPASDLQRAGLEREFAGYNAVPMTPATSTTVLSTTTNDTLAEPARVADNSDLALSDARPTTAPPTEVSTEGRPNWSQPAFRILPATPVKSNSMEDVTKNDEDIAASKQAANSELPPDNTRELLERWRTSRSNRLEIEEELATRGFRPIPKRLVEQFFSENLADRLRLVDSVLTEPGVDPRPWLILLAEDENAEIRLMAVTVMATSNDKTLVEKAWQTAIRDRDSRIADLAARLRQRRDGATRR